MTPQRSSSRHAASRITPARRHSARPLRAMLAVALAAALVLAVASGGCARVSGTAAAPSSISHGLRSGELASEGYLRTWTVYVPPGIAPKSRVPLVVVLHGSGSSGREAIAKDGWIPEADRRGFIVVAPDGLPVFPDRPADPTANPTVWNDGRLTGSGPRAQVDDTAFITAMLDHLDAELPVDASRTYVAGHSNGGGMAFRLAAEASSRIAALAVVASVQWTDERPTLPMPTLVIVGTHDSLVPLNGGRVVSPFFAQTRPVFRTAMEKWARSLGIASPEPVTVLDDANVRVERWENGAIAPPESSEGSTMTVVYVKGQAHSWPGGTGAGLPQTPHGPTPPAVDATDLAWRSFASAPPR